MTRSRIVHRCTRCGTSHPQWSGRCAGCGEWNSLIEDLTAGPAPAALNTLGCRAAVCRIGQVDPLVAAPRPTRLPELDRVLGGGLVPGSVTLVGGEPGVGKSTLLLQLLARAEGRCLYVTGEESAQQVRGRAERLGAVRDDLWLLAETSVPHILAAIDQVAADLVVVDSIQTIADPDVASTPGSVPQVRACAQHLVRTAKSGAVTVVVVGHVTKDGGLAGPRALEHVVDTVLSFDGDRHHSLRLLRATKHRFGPTDELGLWEMTEDGLVGVPDAGALFLADRRPGTAGSVVVPHLDGRRPLVVEVQALTAPTPPGAPQRRVAQGFDGGRLALLLAVLGRAGVELCTHDVYAAAIGGVRLAEPGTDLGVCLAVASARLGRPLPPDLVVLGEVGLTGELRQVGNMPRRLAEAARLGFARALLPATSPPAQEGITAVRVSTLAEALAVVGLLPRGNGSGDQGP